MQRPGPAATDSAGADSAKFAPYQNNLAESIDTAAVQLYNAALSGFYRTEYTKFCRQRDRPVCGELWKFRRRASPVLKAGKGLEDSILGKSGKQP